MRPNRNKPEPPAAAYNAGLHRFAVLTAIATLGLLGIGGLVTSNGAGMAVPDWPNTYGYNMFFFPISQWMGNIFYEHTHRLAASGVGLLTSALALWLYGRSARPFMRWAGAILLLAGGATAAAVPRRWTDGLVLGLTGLALLGASRVWPRCEPSAKWLRRLGLAAFFAVVLQGVLGGLRVILFKDAIGIFHATLAQLFFVLTCAIALFTSRWWQTRPTPMPTTVNGKLTTLVLGLSRRVGRAVLCTPPRTQNVVSACRGLPALPSPAVTEALPTLYLLATVLILGQLALGATMRHQHAGLAIPDFPLAYGKLWPAMDASAVARYNQQRIEVVAANPITAFQIALQMIHRLLALAILGAVAYAAWATRRVRLKNHATGQVVGRASRLPEGRPALGPRNAGETPEVAGGTPAPLPERRLSLLSRMTLGWLGLILTQAALGAATIWSNKAADIATAHVLVGALSLALGAILCIVSSRELMSASRVTDLSTAPRARATSSFGPLPPEASPLPQ